jgi:hypothetical protein
MTIQISRTTRRANWWGLGCAAGLLVWFLFWFKRGPSTRNEAILFWVTLALIHFLGVKAARQRFGLIYLVPLGVVWIVIVVALSGGITEP